VTNDISFMSLVLPTMNLFLFCRGQYYFKEINYNVICKTIISILTNKLESEF